MKEILEFLEELEINNNRERFDENRDWYKKVRKDVVKLADFLLGEIWCFYNLDNDLQANKCLFRINRDTRYSKDKTPYKKNFGIEIANWWKRNGWPSFYLHIQPWNNSFVWWGIYMPDSEFTRAIRNSIDKDFGSLKKILNKKKFKEVYWGFQETECVKTAPRWFTKDHKNIEFIRMKNWILNRAISDDELLSGNFNDSLIEYFKVMAPLNKWLEDIFLKTG